MSIPSPPPGLPAPRLDAGRIAELIDIRFPQIHAGGRTMLIEEVHHASARVRMSADPRHMRPGGTISGPAMFALTDFSVYVAIIASLGEPGFDWVTSSLNINFLTRPSPTDMTAVTRLIRLGAALPWARSSFTPMVQPTWLPTRPPTTRGRGSEIVSSRDRQYDFHDPTISRFRVGKIIPQT